MSWFRPESATAVAERVTTLDEPDDARLVLAAQADHRVFTVLYERYVDRVYRYCYARLGSREAAEDATSEVFLKALAALDRYHDVLFAAWLFRIAHNVVMDIRRRRLAAPLDAARLERRPDPDRTPEEVAVAQAERERLDAALAQLTAEQRAIIELPYAGWTGEQIADALGRSPNAVKQLRYRTLRRLRMLLNQPETTAEEGVDA